MVCGLAAACGGSEAVPPDATVGTFSVTFDGDDLCPLGFEGPLGAVASGGEIHLGANPGNGTIVPLACLGNAGDLNQLDFANIPGVGETAPCGFVMVTQGGPRSYCATDAAPVNAPTGTITVSGTADAYFVSGSCACAGSEGGTSTSEVTFDNIPLAI